MHRKVYSETSLLIDLFTEEAGRVSLVAKGARAKKSNLKAILQPFTPLLIRWVGLGNLKTLTKAEAITISLPLEKVALYSGFYVNELITRTIEASTSYPSLFQDYLACLTDLAQSQAVEPILRQFEFNLLATLGYSVDFRQCFDSGTAIIADKSYQYLAEKGFTALITNTNNNTTNEHSIFYGQDLLAFSQNDFTNKQTLQAAKRFARMALAPYLGSKPLKSRELFQTARYYKT